MEARLEKIVVETDWHILANKYVAEVQHLLIRFSGSETATAELPRQSSGVKSFRAGTAQYTLDMTSGMTASAAMAAGRP